MKAFFKHAALTPTERQGHRTTPGSVTLSMLAADDGCATYRWLELACAAFPDSIMLFQRVWEDGLVSVCVVQLGLCSRFWWSRKGARCRGKNYMRALRCFALALGHKLPGCCNGFHTGSVFKETFTETFLSECAFVVASFA